MSEVNLSAEVWTSGPGEHYREVGPTPLRGRVTRREG